MIKIVIADDHEMVIDGLMAVLENVEDYQVIGKANSGHEVLQLLQKQVPDIILMDIDMPNMNGMECTAYVKKHYSDVKVLILSMHGDAAHIKEVLNKGADGYILKNTGKKELVQAITALLKGRTYFDQAVTNELISDHRSEERKSKSWRMPDLSAREKEIIKLICDEKTQVEISDILSLSEHTVKTHRKNILRKLNVKNTAGLVKFAVENNLS